MRNKLQLISLLISAFPFTTWAQSVAGESQGFMSKLPILLISVAVAVVFITIKRKVSTTIIKFADCGGLLGFPLSYYFQPDIVKYSVNGIGGYLRHFDKIFNNMDLFLNVLISAVIFAIIGGLIGYLVDKNKSTKTS